jgi:hypothetical protein
MKMRILTAATELAISNGMGGSCGGGPEYSVNVLVSESSTNDTFLIDSKSVWLCSKLPLPLTVPCASISLLCIVFTPTIARLVFYDQDLHFTVFSLITEIAPLFKFLFLPLQNPVRMVRIITHGRNVAFGVPHPYPSVCLAAGLHHLSTQADKSDQNIKN